MKIGSCGRADLPFVKARRAIGFACRSAEAPLRRTVRAIGFMMGVERRLMELMGVVGWFGMVLKVRGDE